MLLQQGQKLLLKCHLPMVRLLAPNVLDGPLQLGHVRIIAVATAAAEPGLELA